MESQQAIERLRKVCKMIADSFEKFDIEIKAVAVNVQNMSVSFDAAVVNVVENIENEELLRQFGEAQEEWLADIANEQLDVPKRQKLQRPPKCIKPINRANYIANRPQRVARSKLRK